MENSSKMQKDSGGGLKEEMKIWIDGDGIVNVKMVKDISRENVQKLIDEGIEVIKKIPGSSSVMVDLTSGLINLPSESRREIGEQAKKFFSDLNINKVAIFGGVMARTIASFIIMASGLNIEKVKLFGNKESALKWLKQN
jgi:hypothetical protein